MKQPVIIKLFSVLINMLICLVGGSIVLYFQDWYSSGDLPTLLCWTMLLATGLAVGGKTLLSFYRTQNRLFRCLLIVLTAGLIAFGFVDLLYLLLGPWLRAFRMPVFYLWIAGAFGQLLWLDLLLPDRAANPKPSKMVLGVAAYPLTVIAAMIGIFVLFFTPSPFAKPEPETFIFPPNFEGKVRIVYGEACGVLPPLVKGRRELQIPNDGLLIIQPRYEAGIIDHEYYFVDQNGKRRPIKRYENYSDGSKNIPGVRFCGSGNMAGAMADGSFSSESPLAIQYADLYVYQDIAHQMPDGESSFQEREFDAMTSAFVKACRAIQAP